MKGLHQALLTRLTLAPWEPQAHLVPHTSAPLASRVSIPPSSSLIPKSLEPHPLVSLSLDEQESAILEDLLFVLMGFEGQYIRYSSKYNANEEKDRLAGPSYKILPGLDPSLRDLANSILKTATYYNAVEAFVEIQSRDEFGAINHALCASVRRILRDYLVFIAQLEHQYLSNENFTLHLLHMHTVSTTQRLFQLHTLAQELLKKNSLLDVGLDDSADEFDDDDILEQLREGGELAPGGMSKKMCKGGNVLRLLTERLSLMSGDPTARTLLQNLLRDASRPYMHMLNEWLHHGAIKDPHAEFLIKEQKSIKREKLEDDYTDEYWEKRYTIRDNEVPPQLEGVKDKVLLAGKYLNVVRECGGVDISKEVKDVPLSFDDPQFLDNVNGAYAHANSSLLSLLVTTHALPARLRSMKHYFFLDRSDFFTYFLDLSASELRKPAKAVNVSKLQSLLDLVLRQPGTVAAQDAFKEDVKVQMNEVGLTKFLMGVVNVRGIDQDATDETMERYQTPATQSATEEDSKMTGFEALEFKFSVPFPLSLVISIKTVLRYQILFRYLLSLRHLEGLLVNSWEDHHKVLSWIHKGADPKLERWKRRAWTLRARMLVFVQHFTYYCTAEVIEPNWQTLMTRVNGCEANNADGSKSANRTVDELMEDHVDFLDTCLKECMLMNPKLLKVSRHSLFPYTVRLNVRANPSVLPFSQTHSKLMTTIQMFATYTVQTLTKLLFTADQSLAGSSAALGYLNSQYSARHPVPDNLKAYDPARLAKLDDLLGKYEANFNRHLQIFLDMLDYYAATETVALSRLCAQLSTASEKRDERTFLG